MEIAGARVEFLPDGHAGAIGVSKFGEVGPIVLHGAGELQLLVLSGGRGTVTGRVKTY